ncbi:MAG: tRNA adenosine deaminase-associated protein [Candidatus Nanopelagicales bacterium]|jgi:putative tRNA adenosine deaminase-associated protein
MDDPGDAGVDFSIAAWREDGRWSMATLPPRAVDTLGGFVTALRQLTGEGGALGFVGVDEACLILVRIGPDGVARLLLSDANAALDYDLAEEAFDLLDLDVPEEEEYEDFEPVGDLALLADFGLDDDTLEMLLGTDEWYPDEQVRHIGQRLGFAEQLDRLLPSRDLPR